MIVVVHGFCLVVLVCSVCEWTSSSLGSLTYFI
jgi:hypothetical protein